VLGLVIGTVNSSSVVGMATAARAAVANPAALASALAPALAAIGKAMGKNATIVVRAGEGSVSIALIPRIFVFVNTTAAVIAPNLKRTATTLLAIVLIATLLICAFIAIAAWKVRTAARTTAWAAKKKTSVASVAPDVPQVVKIEPLPAEDLLKDATPRPLSPPTRQRVAIDEEDEVVNRTQSRDSNVSAENDILKELLRELGEDEDCLDDIDDNAVAWDYNEQTPEDEGVSRLEDGEGEGGGVGESSGDGGVRGVEERGEGAPPQRSRPPRDSGVTAPERQRLRAARLAAMAEPRERREIVVKTDKRKWWSAPQETHSHMRVESVRKMQARQEAELFAMMASAGKDREAREMIDAAIKAREARVHALRDAAVERKHKKGVDAWEALPPHLRSITKKPEMERAWWAAAPPHSELKLGEARLYRVRPEMKGDWRRRMMDPEDVGDGVGGGGGRGGGGGGGVDSELPGTV
jgi:hypothetical protein